MKINFEDLKIYLIFLTTIQFSEINYINSRKKCVGDSPENVLKFKCLIIVGSDIKFVNYFYF